MKKLKIFFLLLSLVLLFLFIKNSYTQEFKHEEVELDVEVLRPLKVIVNIKRQMLYLVDYKDSLLEYYSVSTSKFGEGNEFGSNKTPLGLHRIADKIGNKEPLNVIFKSRISTGKIAEIHHDNIERETDLVTTRILRLEGLEKGKNDNSYLRYIYIHGTPEEGMIGQKASHGCIRMKNQDIIKLFEALPKRAIVDIRFGEDSSR